MSYEKRFEYRDDDLTDYDDEGRQISPTVLISTLWDEETDNNIEVRNDPAGVYNFCKELNILWDEYLAMYDFLRLKGYNITAIVEREYDFAEKHRRDENEQG